MHAGQEGKTTLRNEFYYQTSRDLLSKIDFLKYEKPFVVSLEFFIIFTIH